jgi:pyruvate,water dikinase
LLVMRVTGAIRKRTFYPDLAGVGFSYNPFAWSSDIDPHAGVLRLVYGLGTRAVERVDDDYTRVVALNAPLRRPEADFDEIVRHSQRRVDYIDLDADALRSGDFQKLVTNGGDAPVSLFASQDPQADSASGHEYWFLTFEDVLVRTGFVADMSAIMRTLERVYSHPVDIEFATNFVSRDDYRINLLQCRPLRVSGSHRTDLPAVTAAPEDRLLEASGAVVGKSRVMPVDWIIFVDPASYGVVPERERYAIARAIGKINSSLGRGSGGVMAIGPGRWGTSLPALGIPVEFSEINRVSAVCELAMMHANLTPDISLGTHFFGELVELDLLYFALFPGKEGNRIDLERLRQAPNQLSKIAPEAAGWSRVLRVIAASDLASDNRRLLVLADTPNLRVVCYCE